MPAVIPIDLTGRRALVVGVADDVGFGFAIAKALAEAGANVCIGTWPPALGIFETLLRRGKLDASRQMSSGKLLEFERMYAVDAAYDTLEQVPEAVRDSKRYASRGDFTIDGIGKQLVADFGEKPLDIVVHSLANGPEVHLPLVETSRAGYLAALQRERVLVRVDGPALGTAHAPGRLVPVAHLPRQRARDPRVRGWHELGQGSARERHADPGL